MKENFLFETNDLFHGHNLTNVLDNIRHLRDIANEGPAKMYFSRYLINFGSSLFPQLLFRSEARKKENAKAHPITNAPKEASRPNLVLFSFQFVEFISYVHLNRD